VKIYTRTGDAGETGLFGGPRVAKDAPRVEVCGSVDELNAMLGVVRAGWLPAEADELLERVQHELFDMGAELATRDATAHATPSIGSAEIAALEAAIDRLESALTPLSQFILPGGDASAAQVHLARAVCRRAERRLVTLAHDPGGPLSPHLLIYLNRLGDLLFVLARWLNAAAGCPDVPWRRGSE